MGKTIGTKNTLSDIKIDCDIKSMRNRFIAILILHTLINSIVDFNILGQQPVFINGTQEFTSSNLPIVFIETNGQEIVNEPRIVAEMGIIYNGEGQRNYVTDTFNNYNGRIEIELRGSATLYYPKKQYRLETQDSLGENLNVEILGMPRENDWILYGPYDDQSLIRNVLAYKLSNDIDRYADSF